MYSSWKSAHRCVLLTRGRAHLVYGAADGFSCYSEVRIFMLLVTLCERVEMSIICCVYIVSVKVEVMGITAAEKWVM